MTLTNLHEFLNVLDDNDTKFYVDALLWSSDVISQPTIVEIYNIVMQTVNNFLDR